jgi:DNA-binding NtrC family response regulator
MSTPLRTIVLVDDEKAFLEVLRDLFESEYRVFAFSDPSKALEFLKTDEDVDFLVTDLEMAPIDGLQLVRLVRMKRPNLGVLVLTGNPVSPLISAFSELSSTGVKFKPIELGVLAEIVRRGGDFASLGENAKQVSN